MGVRLSARGQVWLPLLAAGVALAQPQNELIRPPSANGPDLTAASASDPAPVDTDPALPESPLPLEEVIVVSESEWRLPDLGSEWRRAEAAEPDDDRIQLSVLPLYDPENNAPTEDLFERNSALHRMQMIEVIRVRFGGRPSD